MSWFEWLRMMDGGFQHDPTLVLEFFFLEAGLLAPVPLLNPIFSSERTRCCSSSDRV